MRQLSTGTDGNGMAIGIVAISKLDNQEKKPRDLWRPPLLFYFEVLTRFLKF